MPWIDEAWKQQKQRIADEARPFLPPGEAARFIVLAQTRLPNWFGPLPFGAIYGARKRALLVGAEGLYLLGMPLLSPTRVNALIETHPLREGRLSRGGFGSLRLGTTRLWPIANALMRREVEAALQTT